MVEAFFLEDGDDAAVFHPAVFDDEVEEELADLGCVLQVAEAVVFDDLGDGEHCAGVEPA